MILAVTLGILVGCILGTFAGVKIAAHLMYDLKRAWTGRIESLLDNVRGMVGESLTTINPTISRNIENSFAKVDQDLKRRLQVEEVVRVPPEIVNASIKSLDECERHLLHQVSLDWSATARKNYADMATRAFAARRLLEEYTGFPDKDSLMVSPPDEVSSGSKTKNSKKKVK